MTEAKNIKNIIVELNKCIGELQSVKLNNSQSSSSIEHTISILNKLKMEARFELEKLEKNI